MSLQLESLRSRGIEFGLERDELVRSQDGLTARRRADHETAAALFADDGHGGLRGSTVQAWQNLVNVGYIFLAIE